MADYEERRDTRFYKATIATLNDIEQRLGTIEPSADQIQSSLRYAAAYGVLRGYVETLLVNFAASFSEDQLADIRIVLDQLRTLVREDEHIDEATREKLDQLAQALRESDESFHVPEHDPHRDSVAEFNHEQAITMKKVIYIPWSRFHRKRGKRLLQRIEGRISCSIIK